MAGVLLSSATSAGFPLTELGYKWDALFKVYTRYHRSDTKMGGMRLASLPHQSDHLACEF